MVKKVQANPIKPLFQLLIAIFIFVLLANLLNYYTDVTFQNIAIIMGSTGITQAILLYIEKGSLRLW